VAERDPYFRTVDDDSDWGVPETISGDDNLIVDNDNYVTDKPVKSWGKKAFALLFTISAVIFTWQCYVTLNSILAANVILGVAFGSLLTIFAVLLSVEVFRFYKGQRQLAKAEQLREQSALFIRERSHGKSDTFITELTSLYQHTAQGDLLMRCLNNRPDYLNDAEVIDYLSEHFVARLDQQAYRLIQNESVNIGVLIALSPLAVLDALVALWRSFKLVNQINKIYGLSLTRVGQWQVFFKIIKMTLLAAGTEAAISTMIEKTSTGMTGLVAGSVAQGIGVSIYVSRLGHEAIKQSRPISSHKKAPFGVTVLVEGIMQKLRNKDKDNESNS
jgi:putative membrane protein